MVAGIDTFAAHFEGFDSQYRLIGGAATWLLLDDAELEPRATKDLDIVLCAEAITPEFGQRLWEFIQAGEYQIAQRADGTPTFYRFLDPAQSGYPEMLEFFSRDPNVLPDGLEGHLARIPLGESLSSLSAILLDEAYYRFVRENGTVVRGVQLADEYCLILLKARAWLDLSRRKSEGDQIGQKEINKHLGDVYRLAQLIDPSKKLSLDDGIRSDLIALLEQKDLEISPKQLSDWKIRNIEPVQLINVMQKVYGLESAAITA